MDATASLEVLRDELTSRGWTADLRRTRSGPVLHVQHPAHPRMNDDVVSDGAAFRWAWGQGIGPVAEVSAAADRIQYVLREVGA
ncbi:hypothetical protein Acsp04_63860 [Actinomadura sp. NBRC 104425]|uniref:hypothetical protein n=1 Tax=Actinomadura sp. NBRC 104425 TaxID=3032204 RepID=UPI0024A3FB92|nr:hypothetical protein [Actinomadura sp. NBRC 104425]GLZ16151.1 hypothetical protein Acsp04_63860 [Actinomadura sp. NBRC 104425]